MSERDHELAVYLVVNGPLEMSTGKIAAQAFQAAQRLFRAASHPDCPLHLIEALRAWEAEGTRTITRVAQTAHVFSRVVAEVEGVVMVDEGLTEVEPGSVTVFASWPIPMGDAPRALRHRRCPLLRGVRGSDLESQPESPADPENRLQVGV
ncbi:peptidyl-tRNA hydrolase [Miltoncostaea oceani]|uniref:peptidyl-tRNA hydrolase n=1 Tax=Miltoncostaea oceani TaxID=2843216 RepID=UPI001C3C2F4B|nr:peptidyl-tRNA hydrolase [Miltoncostaea oceani]